MDRWIVDHNGGEERIDGERVEDRWREGGDGERVEEMV